MFFQKVQYTASALENLELFLFDTNDLVTPVASSISTVDNVEHLFLTAPATGNYVFEVRSASGAVVSPLSYSLAWDVDVPPGLAGDFDMDNDADGFDFLQWQRGESSNPLSPSELADWDDNYGTPAPVLAAGVIPEPSTGCLMLVGLGAFWMRKRRGVVLRNRKRGGRLLESSTGARCSACFE